MHLPLVGEVGFEPNGGEESFEDGLVEGLERGDVV